LSRRATFLLQTKTPPSLTGFLFKPLRRVVRSFDENE
jgi:hypothetical protein